MKKQVLRKFNLWIGCLLASYMSYSQLSGTYTVGTGQTYTTLQAAFTDAYANGIDGDVVFEIVDGYDVTERVTIGGWTGDDTYTITVRPEDNATSIYLRNANNVIRITGSTNLIFDGADPITGNNVINLVGYIWMRNGAHDVEIKNLNIDAYAFTGINMFNDISSNPTCYDITIQGNNITSSYEVSNFKGIDIGYSDATNIRVIGNLIHITETTATGAAAGVVGRSGLIAYNNVIHFDSEDGRTFTGFSTLLDGDIEVVHNTIVITGGSPSALTYVYGIDTRPKTHHKIENNLIHIDRQGHSSSKVYALSYNDAFAGTYSYENNNMSVVDYGLNYQGYLEWDYNNPIDDQTAVQSYAPNTTFSVPTFTNTSNEDLTLSGSSTSEPDFRTDPDANVTVDYNGATRSVNAVTKGAYELPNNIADITGFTLSEQHENAVIDNGDNTIFIEVAEGTNLTDLTPTITAFPGASTNPASGVSRNFSTSQSYTVTAEDLTAEIWNVTVVHKNDAPTDLAISPNNVDENVSTGTVVGSFSSTDSDSGDSHSYELVSGEGDTDNASFTIDGTSLKTSVALNFETKSSYFIRVRTDDNVTYGGTYEKALTIDINDLIEAPSSITLEDNAVDEGAPVGEVVGSFFSYDEDEIDEEVRSHSYSLVSGSGDTDNGKFSISDDKLITAQGFDFEDGSTYSIRIQSEDGDGLTYQDEFEITITEVDAGSQGSNGEFDFKLVASDRNFSDYFGSSVDLDGDFAIIGSKYHDLDENGSNYVTEAGAAYIFKNDGSGTWMETQKIVASVRTSYLNFGGEVAISGNYAFVGVPYGDDPTTGNADGIVYVFKNDGTGNWTETQVLVPSDSKDEEMEFGYSIDAYGDYLVVSAVYDYYDENGNNYADDAGSAYVFKVNGSGTWEQVQKLVASDRMDYARYFSESVAIHGNYIAIAAPEADILDDDGMTVLEGVGATYLFENQNGTWVETQKLVISDREADDYTGYTLSLTGNTLVIGDENKDYMEGSNVGAAYVFQKDSNGDWIETAKINPNDPFSNQRFGSNVAITGNTLLIQSSNGETQNDYLSRIFVYSENGSGDWVLTDELVSPDLQAQDNYGESMSIDGVTAIIGADREDEDENGENTLSGAGSAYFFDVCENPDIPEIVSSKTQVCSGGEVTLSFSGANLNGASSWEWYSGSCAGTPVGSGTSIQVNPTETTTYYVRGEGGCATSNTCAFITVEVYEECPETDILSFDVPDQVGDEIINSTDHTVKIEVALTTDLTALTPTIITSTGGSIDPASGVSQDYTNPVTYTVTAENNDMQQWTVTITNVSNTATDILSFSLEEQTEDASIDSENHTVTIEVKNETDLTTLVPTITLSNGATVDPASGVARDFSDAVIYTVTAEDESTQQEWTVTVTEKAAPKSTETDILTFSLEEQTGPAIIDAENHTINIQVKFGTGLSQLKPTLTVSEGASYSPSGTIDFSQDVILSVTAEDGSTIQDWTVKVAVEAAPLSTETEILSFSFAEQVQAATIDGDNHTVSITVNPDADLSQLEPTVSVSEGATYSPSGPVDFSSPVPFLVTAEDEVTTQEWMVTVKQEVTTGFGEDIDVQVFPNPVVDQLFIKSREALEVKLINLQGVELNHFSGNQIQIDMSGLRAGIYVLLINSDTLSVRKRLMKMN